MGIPSLLIYDWNSARNSYKPKYQFHLCQIIHKEKASACFCHLLYQNWKTNHTVNNKRFASIVMAEAISTLVKECQKVALQIQILE